MTSNERARTILNAFLHARNCDCNKCVTQAGERVNKETEKQLTRAMEKYEQYTVNCAP